MKEFSITDEQILKAFNGTSFGSHIVSIEQKTKLVVQASLKRVCDYSTGHTMSAIMHELRITKTMHGKPIKAARRWMYDYVKDVS